MRWASFVMIDDWEEECRQSIGAALGGGVCSSEFYMRKSFLKLFPAFAEAARYCRPSMIGQ